MATKAAHTAFNRSVAAYLQSIGAEILKDSQFEKSWRLDTFVGDILVSLKEPERIEVFSIFCRYTQMEVNFNLHSYDAKELLDEFKEQIQPLLWESIDINDPDFDPTIKL